MSLFTIQIDDLVKLGAFCEALAMRLTPGDVIALNGDLGAGKTTLVQHLCGKLGVTEPVNSPTFSIAHRYHAQNYDVIHVDAYRIEDETDPKLITLDEAIVARNCLVLVEWAEKLPSFDACWTWDIQMQCLPNDSRLCVFARHPKNMNLSEVFASCTY